MANQGHARFLPRRTSQARVAVLLPTNRVREAAASIRETAASIATKPVTRTLNARGWAARMEESAPKIAAGRMTTNHARDTSNAGGSGAR